MKLTYTKKIIFLVNIAVISVFAFNVFANINEAEQMKFLLDSDQDSLTDTEEKTYGTNPNKADTDNDGYSDGVEVKSGYNPLKPAPGDKIMVAEESKTSNSSNNLTAQLSEELKPLVSSLDEENSTPVTIDSLDNAINNALGERLNQTVTPESLPEFSIPQDKIILQNYSNLSEQERKEKIKKDIENYVVSVVYVFVSNLPAGVEDSNEIRDFIENSIKHIEDLAKSPADYSYYTPLKENLNRVILELSALSVPENLSGIHTYMIRILTAYQQLEGEAPVNDPIAQTVFINKISGLMQLTYDFIVESQNNIAQYYK